MKKIALPILLAAFIIACAWYVGAKATGFYRTPGPHGHGPDNPITVSSGALTMNVSTDNPSVLQGSDGRMILHIDIEAAKARIEGRKPLNLALVIDRSGSMADRGKIEYARKAAMELIDRLGRNDRVAVVIYDDEARVLVPSTLMTNPGSIKRAIAALNPGGATNLSGGLILGRQEVKQYFNNEGINQVIILSDGLANRGITSQTELASMVSSWSEEGVRVTSMGLGADFNEDLMMGLANASGGHYYFIESPSQLAGIYEKELNTLMQTVGKDVKIILNLAEGVKFDRVQGYNARVNGARIEIPLGNFNSREHRIIMAHLDVPTGRLGTAQVADVRLEYRDLTQDSRRIADVARIDIACITDVAAVEDNRNMRVEGDNYWVENSNENAEAINRVQQGKKDEAARWYKSKIEEIKKRNRIYNSPQLDAQAEQYQKELDELEAVGEPASEAGKVFIKRGKANQRLDALGYAQ